MTEQRTPTADNLDPYDGRWVAMREGKVVAHAEDEQAIRMHPSVRSGDLVFPVGPPVTGFYMLNV